MDLVMQPREIMLLDDAIEDLREIRRVVYRLSKSRVVADNYIKRIRAQLRHIEYTAEACPRYVGANGLDLEYWFTPVEHYLAFFLVEEDVVKVDRILYSRRDFDRELGA